MMLQVTRNGRRVSRPLFKTTAAAEAFIAMRQKHDTKTVWAVVAEKDLATPVAAPKKASSKSSSRY
jgi:hypothetical protein